MVYTRLLPGEVRIQIQREPIRASPLEGQLRLIGPTGSSPLSSTVATATSATVAAAAATPVTSTPSPVVASFAIAASLITLDLVEAVVRRLSSWDSRGRYLVRVIGQLGKP
jgi:hypothetical protein